MMKFNNSKPILVFDVNETLLDMSPLKKEINVLLDEEQGFRIWFGTLLHYSTVSNHIDHYYNFTELAISTLEMTAKSLNKVVTQEQIKNSLSVIKTLKTYPDVAKGLQFLKEHNFRLITLTNSTKSVLEEQLVNSNLTAYFEKTLSIDTISKYKPAKETYHWAAKELGIKPEQMLMIAAHGWDIAGASCANLKTGFIQREGQSLYTLAKKPDFTASDILEMAHQLVLTFK